MQTEQFRWCEESGWQPYPPPGSLGASAQVVLLFASPDLIRNPEWYDTVRQAYPGARLFGCSSSGQIAGTEVGDRTVAVTAVAFEHTTVEVARVRFNGRDTSGEAGQRLARCLNPEGLRCVFVLCEGIQANANDAVDGLNSVLPAGVATFGGCAANGHNLDDTYVIAGAPPEPGWVAALGLYGDRLKVGFGSSGGWDPFGLDRLITRSRKNVLYEFDGRPALPIYKKYIGAAAQHLPASAMLYPLSLRTGDTPHAVLRGVLAVDEGEQSITFAGNVPEGCHARFMFGSVEHLIDGSIVAAERARDVMGSVPPELLLVVSCVARQLVLKQRTGEELECLGESFPLRPAITGFYALGEVAPIQAAGDSGFHNETMTVAGLAEI